MPAAVELEVAQTPSYVLAGRYQVTILTSLHQADSDAGPSPIEAYVKLIGTLGTSKCMSLKAGPFSYEVGKVRWLRMYTVMD